jgi:hypothetical protein
MLGYEEPTIFSLNVIHNISSQHQVYAIIDKTYSHQSIKHPKRCQIYGRGRNRGNRCSQGKSLTDSSRVGNNQSSR